MHLDHKYKVIIDKQDYEKLQLNEMIAINFIPNSDGANKHEYTGGRIDLSVEKLDSQAGIQLGKK